MKISDIFEAPLPDDWDREQFSPRNSYKKMIAYAKERAEQVGRGSGRVALKVMYQGRPTVIKVATGNKGIVQNQEESMLLGDHYLQRLGIVIPMIDHDEENGRYVSWIHTEFAEKITQKQLERYFGGISMHRIVGYLNAIQGRTMAPIDNEISDTLEDNDLFQDLENLVSNFGLPANDLATKANWGIYKGRPVIIDMGFTDTSAKLYGM